MEAICFSETSVDFQRTTRSYIPEDGTLLFIIYALHPIFGAIKSRRVRRMGHAARAGEMSVAYKILVDKHE
jgi:hypothetical protein